MQSNDALFPWHDLQGKKLSPSPPTSLTLACPSSFGWLDNTHFPCIKSKTIYNTLMDSSSVVEHLNVVWNLELSKVQWSKALNRRWLGPFEPKKKFFVWRLLLNRLPFKDPNGNVTLCQTYCLPESVKHISVVIKLDGGKFDK
ncbi:hypothetical protein SUGI_0322450 [Cryptomeria japonica]|nr:hypothetical protein SUGI_0322450 [Cryptomeria japonica]